MKLFLGEISLPMKVITRIIWFNRIGKLVKQFKNNYEYYVGKKFISDPQEAGVGNSDFVEKTVFTAILFQVHSSL